MKKFLALLILLPLAAMADPSISGWTGTPDHGEIITVSGSGFGSKGTPEPWFYADFDGHGITGDETTDHYATTGFFGHPNYLCDDGWECSHYVDQTPTGAGHAVGLRYPDPNKTAAQYATHDKSTWCLFPRGLVYGEHLYVNFQEWWDWPGVQYIRDECYPGTGGIQNKMHRISHLDIGVNPDDQPWSKNGFNWDGGVVKHIFSLEIEGSGDSGADYVAMRRSDEDVMAPANTWHTQEYEIDFSSGPGVHDGTYRDFLYGDDFTRDGLSWCEPDGNGGAPCDTLVRGMKLFLEMISWDRCDDDMDMPWDPIALEVFDSFYADTSQARLITADASVLANATRRIAQVCSVWDADEIQFTLDAGPAYDGESWWLYVRGPGGNYSSGYPITINGTAVSVTPPGPPLGTRTGDQLPLTWTAMTPAPAGGYVIWIFEDGRLRRAPIAVDPDVTSITVTVNSSSTIDMYVAAMDENGAAIKRSTVTHIGAE